MSTQRLCWAGGIGNVPLVVLKNGNTIRMYVEQDRLVVCDDPGEEVYIFETVSGNATSLEVARTLLASGSKRAIVVDRDTGVLGTLSVLMLVRIMERVLL